MLVTSIFSFYHNIFYPSQNKFQFFTQVYFSFLSSYRLTFYHTILTFNKRSLLKTLWEKEEMLVTSIFSFSHNVFYPSQNKFQFFSHIYLSSANAFSLNQSKILSFGKELIVFSVVMREKAARCFRRIAMDMLNM